MDGDGRHDDAAQPFDLVGDAGAEALGHLRQVQAVLHHAGPVDDAVEAARAQFVAFENLGNNRGLATIRASLGIYNTRDDIDALVRGLHKVREVFA